MKTIYVDRRDSELEVQGGRLQISIPGTSRPFFVPLNMLEFLVISATVRFTSTLLSRLADAGVTVVVINNRKTSATCIAHGLLHNAAERRLKQYRALNNDELKLRYSTATVRQKFRGHRIVLMRAMRRRSDQRYVLNKAVRALGELEQSLDQTAGIDSLRGVEGAGAAIYFDAYKSVFAPRLNFNGRNRRPPRDPVNVALSLTYTLIHAEAVRALVSAGFDPQLGFYHLPSYGRESLACDMAEIYRPLADYWVWRLFANEILREDHFSSSDSAERPCVLGKAGRAVYYEQYDSQARRWRRLMRRTARVWLDVLQQDLPEQPNARGADCPAHEFDGEFETVK